MSKQPSFPRDIPDRDKGRLEIDDSGEVKVYLFIASNQYNPAIRLSIGVNNNIVPNIEPKANQYHIPNSFAF